MDVLVCGCCGLHILPGGEGEWKCNPVSCLELNYVQPDQLPDERMQYPRNTNLKSDYWKLHKLRFHTHEGGSPSFTYVPCFGTTKATIRYVRLPSPLLHIGLMLGWFSTLKMEVTRPSETSVHIRIALRCIPEDDSIRQYTGGETADDLSVLSSRVAV
jgi:hypothetical protein